MGNFFKVEDVFEYLPQLLEFLPITLFLSVFSVIIGQLFGALIAVIRVRQVPVLNPLAKLYVSFIRGTPEIIQLYIAYFGIPMIIKAINGQFATNISIELIPKTFYAIMAFSFNMAAYSSEVFRSSLLSVDRGEIEAAYTIGMNRNQALRRIIVPHAMTVALPSLGNLFISQLKGTSLAFSVGVVEMTAAGQIIGGRTYRFIEIYVALAIIYWILTIILERFIAWGENKMSVPGDMAYNSSKGEAKL